MEPTYSPMMKPSSASDINSPHNSRWLNRIQSFMNNPQSYKSIILSIWTLAHMCFERHETVVVAYFRNVKARQGNDTETSLQLAIFNESVFKTITIIQCHLRDNNNHPMTYKDNIETITVIQCQYRTITIIQWPCMNNFKTLTIILRHCRTITASNDLIKIISSSQSRWQIHAV